MRLSCDIADQEIFEQAAEFLVASKHYARGKADGDDLSDELADLHIMIEQLSLFVGREATEQRVQEKMDRLRRRLDCGNPAWSNWVLGFIDSA